MSVCHSARSTWRGRSWGGCCCCGGCWRRRRRRGCRCHPESSLPLRPLGSRRLFLFARNLGQAGTWAPRELIFFWKAQLEPFRIPKVDFRSPKTSLFGSSFLIFFFFFSSPVSGSISNGKMSSNVPADMINLRLILVSGKTKEFLFSPNDSASDIAKHVYDNWPMDWEEEQVSSPNILRLIYQGRFLHGNVTLGALKLPFGKTTVMHLVARETLPEPNSQGQRNREKTGESNCCVIL